MPPWSTTNGAESFRADLEAAGTMTGYSGRAEAGRRLGDHLAFLRGEPVTVLGVYRSGLPVASEVADVVGAPLDLIVARRLVLAAEPGAASTTSAPATTGPGTLGPGIGGPAIGAIAEGEVLLLDKEAWGAAGGDATWGGWLADERRALAGTAEMLRSEYPALDLFGRTAVVVDDGMRSGWTARAAATVARARGSERVLVAVPAASPAVIVTVGSGAEVVCLEVRAGAEEFERLYARYGAVGDAEVRALLRRHQPLRSRG